MVQKPPSGLLVVIGPEVAVQGTCASAAVIVAKTNHLSGGAMQDRVELPTRGKVVERVFVILKASIKLASTNYSIKLVIKRAVLEDRCDRPTPNR